MKSNVMSSVQNLCESQTRRDINSKGFWWHYVTHRITWFLGSYPVSVVHNRKLYFEISCFCFQLKRLWGIYSIGYVSKEIIPISHTGTDMFEYSSVRQQTAEPLLTYSCIKWNQRNLPFIWIFYWQQVSGSWKKK